MVYPCYEQANHSESSSEYRSHRDTLPQGQRPSGAQPLAHHLAAREGVRRPKRLVKSPATARHGSAPLLIAPMTRVPKAWATAATAILAARSSSRKSSKRSSNRPSMSLQPMVACGLAPKSPAGSRATRDARCIRSGVGSLSSGSTTLSGCCGHATPKPILPPKQRVSGAASVSSSHRRAMGDRSAPCRAQTDPAPRLGAQRLPPACRRPASLPVALRLQFCPAGFWTDRVVALADGAGGCVHDCVGAVRSSCQRRPGEADPAGPRVMPAGRPAKNSWCPKASTCSSCHPIRPNCNGCRALVAALQRGSRQPVVPHPRRSRGRTDPALCGAAEPAGGHPLAYALSLVASFSLKTSVIHRN
jgi:hypothetical protein